MLLYFRAKWECCPKLADCPDTPDPTLGGKNPVIPYYVGGYIKGRFFPQLWHESWLCKEKVEIVEYWQDSFALNGF